jgi:hypothetical protein
VAPSRSAPDPLIPALLACALAAALAVASLLRAAAAAEAPALVDGVAAVGAAGLLGVAAAVLSGRAALVGWGVALLAAQYALFALGRGASVDASAPAVGLALVLVAELSHTACEWRGPHAVDATLERRRWARVAGTAVAGAVAGGGALALAAAVPGSVPGLLIGAAGVVGLVGLASWLRHAGSAEPQPAP